MNRRSLLATGASALALSPLRALAQDQIEAVPLVDAVTEPMPDPLVPQMPDFYDAITTEPYPVPAVPPGVVPPELWRQEVDNPFTGYAEGDVIVDPDAANLHLVLANGRALRYGVSVGASGFDWQGDAVIQYGREWPRWKVPAEMIERRPEFAPYSVENGGMDPGPGNPLGARALYLFQNGEDTLYRIHGASEPETLGKAVSSGCIRLLDQDAIDFYDRVEHGARVVVLKSVRPPILDSLY